MANDAPFRVIDPTAKPPKSDATTIEYDSPSSRARGERQLSEQATRSVQALAPQSGNPPAEPPDLPTTPGTPFTGLRET